MDVHQFRIDAPGPPLLLCHALSWRSAGTPQGSKLVLLHCKINDFHEFYAALKRGSFCSYLCQSRFSSGLLAAKRRLFKNERGLSGPPLDPHPARTCHFPMCFAWFLRVPAKMFKIEKILVFIENPLELTCTGAARAPFSSALKKSKQT